MKLWLDTETFSETPIKHGTYRYVADSELMIATWAIDDGPVCLHDYTADPETPVELEMALLEADEVWAHNAMFDRNVVNKHIPLHVPLEKWRCVMVQALSHALPGGLDKLCDILRVPFDQAKHKSGKQLMRMFCQPRPKNTKLRRCTRDTNPKEWAEFCEYAKADITAMREVHKRLPAWNYPDKELAHWHLDQRINDRGFGVDTELARAALEATDRAQRRLSVQVNDLTSGVVTAATQRDKLLEHLLVEFGVDLPDMQGSTLERRLADPDIPEGVKELLRIRLQASTTSTAKYKALLRASTHDRLCGTLQFCGAGRTRRAAGRTFQPQNLPSRGLLPQDEIEFGIEALLVGAEGVLFTDVMQLTSSAIRGTIVPRKGCKLAVSDLSNIEGRDQAWLAGESWKLQAFRDFDAGVGHDLYKLAYAKSFGITPEEVTKAQRQIGKVMELALGYEGGVAAFVTFAADYGVDLEALADLAWPTLPGHLVREAERFYDWTVEQHRPTFGLSRRAFIVCDVFKRAWREGHPNIVATWRLLEENAIAAVNHPGVTIERGMFKFRRDGAWLRIGMPSGRALCYPNPMAEGGKLTYMGINQYSRRWQRLNTYGGKLFENACQSVARDILIDAMPGIEEAGYPIVLHVHDEVLTEPDDNESFSHEHLSELLATNPSWAPDIPLAAGGFEAYRYRKD